jgi:hypothetical protein
MGWKKGPLPPDTYYWGGVVPTDLAPGSGFYFADFHGDHVKVDVLEKDGGYYRRTIRTLKPDEVAWYNNALDLPPTGAKSREG